jgi:outer membrane protein TolC
VKIATAQQEQAIARYGGAVLNAFRDVEVALTNDEILAQRLQFETKGLGERTEAVRIARIRYEAGATDLLSVLQLERMLVATQAEIIRLNNARLANRISLYLALGGSFEMPAGDKMSQAGRRP